MGEAGFRSAIQMRDEEVQSEIGKSSSFLAELLGGVLQVQLVNAEGRSTASAIDTCRRMAMAQWHQSRAEVGFSIVVTSVMAFAILCLIGMGTHEYLHKALSIGSLVAFYAYVTRIFDPVSSAMELYARSQRMFASANRVREAQVAVPSVLDSGKAMTRSMPLG